MAGEEKTEAPTPRRREETREKGQVAKSMEVNSVLVLLAGFLALRYFGGNIAFQLEQLMSHTMENVSTIELTPANFSAGQIGLGMSFVGMMLPLMLAIMVAGVVANVAQAGFLFTTKPLKPDFSRLNPLKGFSRLFSKHSVVELVKSIAKIGIVALFAYQTYQSKFNVLVGMVGEDFRGSMQIVADGVIEIGIKSSLTLLVIAVLDYGFQRWSFEKNLRMTKNEIREEMRRSEGSPELKRRIRRQQRQMSARRMMQNVPKASVVVTNPTHLAVAIEYRPESMRCPKVTAKGERLVAERIKAIARENGVPVLENKPLARALYKSVDIDEEIPAAFYQAVAEVLAFIFSLRREQRWQTQL